MARVDSTRATGVSGFVPDLASRRMPAGTTQELGRLPWFALLFLRAFFLRAFFAMLTSS